MAGLVVDQSIKTASRRGLEVLEEWSKTLDRTPSRLSGKKGPGRSLAPLVKSGSQPPPPTNDGGRVPLELKALQLRLPPHPISSLSLDIVRASTLIPLIL